MVRLVFTCRIVITTLLAIATAATIATLLLSGRSYQIAAVVSTALALLAFAVYAVLGLEARLVAHRSFAHRLWLMSERYRSLLSEVHEGLVETPALLRRRDELIHDLHAIYQFGFAADQDGHETGRRPHWARRARRIGSSTSIGWARDPRGARPRFRRGREPRYHHGVGSVLALTKSWTQSPEVPPLVGRVSSAGQLHGRRHAERRQVLREHDGFINKSAGTERLHGPAYGEMVDVLWKAGQDVAAIRLEMLWNKLAAMHDFALLCGYAMGNFYKGCRPPPGTTAITRTWPRPTA